jgi:hypothetical protein
MIIEITKRSLYQFEYRITRLDKSHENLILDTKTYFHDICHFEVESTLNYVNGFWGMLAQGHSFGQLAGKENPITEDLRFIEKIVGPIQSVYLGYFDKQNFAEFIGHLNFIISETDLNNILKNIASRLTIWERLLVGDKMTLEWTLHQE